MNRTKTRLKFTSQSIYFLSICLLSSNALSHANIQPKDNQDLYSERSYKEGSTAYFNLVLSHGCDGEATTDVTMLIPNATDLTGYTSSGPAGEYSGNALMSVKANVNANWKQIKYRKGEVPSYYSHGAKQEDVRAIVWRKGYVPDDMIETLSIRAATPKLEGCVSRLRVRLPAVQYCGRSKAKAWIKEPTARFSEDQISAGYAPYIDVIRDQDVNPLPADCEQNMEVEAYPSDSGN